MHIQQRSYLRWPFFRIDYRKGLTLQSFNSFFRFDDLSLSQHLWKLKHIRRHPVRWPLFGNEFAFARSV